MFSFFFRPRDVCEHVFWIYEFMNSIGIDPVGVYRVLIEIV